MRNYIKSKQKKVNKLLNPKVNNCGGNFNYIIDINDDGDMVVRLDYYEIIMIDYDGNDIPMSIELFQKLLKLLRSIKPIPDSGGLCSNHLFDRNYEIEIDSEDDDMVVEFNLDSREFIIHYKNETFDINDLDNNGILSFECDAVFYIEDCNNLLLIFKDFIDYDLNFEILEPLEVFNV